MVAENKDDEKITVDILGSEWLIIYKKEDPAFEEANGYCVDVDRTIIVQKVCAENKDTGENNLAFNEYQKHLNLKRVLRHEILHAYLMESGLNDSSLPTDSWATNEEMVDWFARQSPKIFKTYKELKLI